MRRFLAGLLVVAISVAALSITAVPAWAQIPPEVLTGIKAATVFIKVRTVDGGGSGSGFLMQADRDSGLIVTNEHVIAGTKVPGRNVVIPPRSIEVVFDSGRKTERVFPATVLAADDDRDLAILQIKNAKDLPKPLNIGGKVDVVETMTIYIVGFPFGTMLATNKGNPALTIGKGTVSSIRENDKGEAKYVQIDGDINPGNSGGPVVDAKGRLVGVSVAKLMGTNIGLAIPPSELSKMLNGRLEGLSLQVSKADEKTAEISVEMHLIDPLKKIHKASVRVIAVDELKSAPPRDKEGNYLPLPGSKNIDLKIDNQKGTATFTVKSDGQRDRSFLIQPVYLRGDKVVVNAAPSAPYAVRFNGAEVAKVGPRPVLPKMPNNQMPNNNAGPVVALSRPKSSKPLPKRSPGPGLGRAPEPIGEVKSTLLPTTLSRGRPCLCWSEDATAVYHLDFTGVVRRISIPDGKETAVLKTGKNCNWLSRSSRGLVLTVGLTQEMWLLDPDTLDILSRIEVGQVQRVLSAPGLDTAYALSTELSSISVIDLRTSKVVRRYTVGEVGDDVGFESGVMSDDGSYIFTDSRERLVKFRVNGHDVVYEETSPRIIGGVFERFCVSPCGDFVCAPSGGGNYNLSGGTRGYSTYVFHTASLQKAEFVLNQGAYPKAVGFDLPSGLIYTQNSEFPLLIYNTTGEKLKEIRLADSRRNADSARQYLVHPQGRKLVIMTDADMRDGGSNLWYVELLAPGQAPQVAVAPPVNAPPANKPPEAPAAPQVVPPANKSPEAAVAPPAVVNKPPEAPMPPRVEPPMPSKPVVVPAAPQAPPPVVNTTPAIPAAPPVQQIVRKWTDDSGTFSVEASLIEVKNDRAYLRSTDGKKLSIPLGKLSAADQQFILTKVEKKPAGP